MLHSRSRKQKTFYLPLYNKGNLFLSLRFAMSTCAPKREYVQFTSHVSHYHIFFLFTLKQKWLKNFGANMFIFNCTFLRIITSSLKCKSGIIFLVFLSLAQNLMRIEKRSQHLLNKST